MLAMLTIIWVLQLGGLDIAYFQNYESCIYAKSQIHDPYKLSACVPHVQEQK